MATKQIPNSQGEIRQSNRGEVFGELTNSFNLDLTSSIGKMKAARKLSRILSGSDIGNEVPQALLIHSGKYYLATDDMVYVCAATDDVTDADNWEEITITSGALFGLGFETDMVSFGGLVLISASMDINAYTSSSGALDSTWWSSTIGESALTASRTHTLHVHRGGQETLVFADGNKIRYYNSTAGASTITLDSLFVVNCFASGVSAVWAGTYTASSESAYVYEFYIGETIDSTPVARNAYKVDGRAVLAMEVVDNVPYIITEKGHIQAFTGSGFSTVASLPFAYGEIDILNGVQSGLVSANAVGRPVHPKGMRADGENLYFFLSPSIEEGTAGDPINDRTHAGLWEFNTVRGVLTHRGSPTDGAGDAGQVNIKESGPLLIVNDPNVQFLIGATLEGTNNMGLFGDTADTPAGFIETTEFQSGNVQDTFNAIYIKADTLGANDKIQVKYRQVNTTSLPIYADIAWIDSTRLTTTDDVSDILVGDEILITEQYGAGHLAHVTAISQSVSTYTIEIDETIGSAAEVSRARFDRWIKVDEEYTSADGEYKRFGIPVVNTWVKAKIAWEGDVTIREIRIQSEAKNT